MKKEVQIMLVEVLLRSIEFAERNPDTGTVLLPVSLEAQVGLVGLLNSLKGL